MSYEAMLGLLESKQSEGNAMKFQVIGRTEQGNTVYYTGRAGQLFVSPESGKAFDYPTLESARRRAMNLNQMTPIHGIRFFVPSVDSDHFATVLC